MLTKWDERFLRLAEHVASWSKDPSTQVGAVIVDQDRRVVGLGYNGFPRGVMDHEHLLNDRAEKYRRIVHAELNAILNANASVRGCTLYTWPFAPCSDCAKLVIQAGIARVVAPESDNTRWIESFRLTEQMFGQARVQFETPNLRTSSGMLVCSCCDGAVSPSDGKEHRKTC